MKAPIGHAKRMREAKKQERIRKSAPALLEALESARSFIFRHAQTDCNTGELICKKTEAELIKIDAAIAAARG